MGPRLREWDLPQSGRLLDGRGCKSNGLDGACNNVRPENEVELAEQAGFVEDAIRVASRIHTLYW